jgi:hypothetical protein
MSEISDEEKEEQLFEAKALKFKINKFKCDHCPHLFLDDYCSNMGLAIKKVHSCEYNSNINQVCRDESHLSKCDLKCSKCKYNLENKTKQNIFILESKNNKNKQLITKLEEKIELNNKLIETLKNKMRENKWDMESE